MYDDHDDDYNDIRDNGDVKASRDNDDDLDLHSPRINENYFLVKRVRLITYQSFSLAMFIV